MTKRVKIGRMQLMILILGHKKRQHTDKQILVKQIKHKRYYAQKKRGKTKEEKRDKKWPKQTKKIKGILSIMYTIKKNQLRTKTSKNLDHVSRRKHYRKKALH